MVNLFADIPAMRPPHGVKSDFDHGDSNGTTLLAFSWIFTPLAVLMVSLRVLTRAKLKQNYGWGWDDTLIILALLGSIAHAVLVTVGLPLGFGRHFWDIRALNLTPFRLHIFTSFEQAYLLTICSLKLSILLLYKRLFSICTTSKTLIHIGCALVMVTTIPAFGVAIARSLKCDGFQALTTTICHNDNVNKTVTVFSVCNTVTDFYTLIIPVNRILKLHIDRNKKIGLLLIFLAGLTACIMSVARLAMIITKFDSPDQLWDSSKITPFTIVEMNLGIVCSCMMFVPAFIKQAKITTSSLVASGSSNFKSVITFGRYKSQIRSTQDDSTYDIELIEHNFPDLPPFMGRISASSTQSR